MKGANKTKDQTKPERHSASSTSQLVFDSYLYTLADEKQFNRQQPSIKKTNDHPQKLEKVSEYSPPQSPEDKPVFRGPHEATTASTILWYVCVCILFIVAFLALVLSVLYFLTDSSTEQVIKLYGISGAGSLAIVTFVIIFLDCCNDGDREDTEEEAIYRVLQIKENKDKRFAKRHKRRVVAEKEEKPKPKSKPKPVAVQHQRPQQAPIEPHPHPYRHHHYNQPQHIHHIYSHPPMSYHDPYGCPICHKSHTSNYNRYSRADVGVDTSDRLETIAKSKRLIHKSTHDVQTDSKLWDTEHGTQTDRVEGTQISAAELNSIPKNATEVIHETTVLKAPRHILPTLKKSIEQQDKELTLNLTVEDADRLTVTDV